MLLLQEAVGPNISANRALEVLWGYCGMGTAPLGRAGEAEGLLPLQGAVGPHIGPKRALLPLQGE